MQYNSHINNINVTNCALAAIYGFNAYITPIVLINDIGFDFVVFEFTKNIDIPNNADNIHVTIYIDLNPAIKYIKYVKKSYNQCGYV